MNKSFPFLLAFLCSWLSAQDKPSGNMKMYQNFDFVAGEHVLFEDDFLSDTDGEFPAHWVLQSGQAVVNTFNNLRVLAITDGSYGRVAPRMKTKTYLGDEFTLEFDCHFASNQEAPDRLVMFYSASDEYAEVNISADIIKFHTDEVSLTSNYPSALSEAWFDTWHHISMAYNNKQLKVYIDQHRVLVVPTTKIAFARMELASVGTPDSPGTFAHIKIADGGNMNLLNKITTDGKIITHGITFDIGKSTIRPESMGVLNSIAVMLKDNVGLKLEICGHTDSDGDDASNLKLSQQRADAVKAQLVSMGIAPERLTTRGLGETQPIDSNSTPEGRANNRRVEFVKL